MPTPHIIGLDVNGQNICGVNTTTKSIFKTTTTEPVITTESLVFRSGATRTSPTNSSKKTTENKNKSEQGSDELPIESLVFTSGATLTSPTSPTKETTENKIEREQASDQYETYDYLDENVNCSLYGGPKKIDFESKKCTEFNEDGYRCVPFYACEDGIIITKGVGILNIRAGSVMANCF